MILGGITYNADYSGDCDIAWNNPVAGTSDLQVPVYGEFDTLTRGYQVRMDRMDDQVDGLCPCGIIRGQDEVAVYEFMENRRRVVSPFEDHEVDVVTGSAQFGGGVLGSFGVGGLT